MLGSVDIAKVRQTPLLHDRAPPLLAIPYDTATSSLSTAVGQLAAGREHTGIAAGAARVLLLSADGHVVAFEVIDGGEGRGDAQGGDESDEDGGGAHFDGGKLMELKVEN